MIIEIFQRMSAVGYVREIKSLALSVSQQFSLHDRMNVTPQLTGGGERTSFHAWIKLVKSVKKLAITFK